ncbi:ATP-binding cassette domain-containing protein [Thioalkalivibrio sp. XN8]|uniref:ATP-binding cassette domain-containing protein n=1 Tax=Thioalkalivibrio sp. XN8 TaxID=2712863 RepID=UPI0013EB81AB|nr:ATP-binding cassette domain-containing protein [Thioalkalivibrio sp. XN8]NGP54028.1 ATP-binding cassette domain-containing protein [Thioalkalivibrio sp. XN8]
MAEVRATHDRRAASTDQAPAAHPLMPLEVHGVGFAAGGKQIIDNVSFTIRGGARTVILGPNGSGKSLLLRLLHGLLAPASGRISWAGLSPARARRRQGMVFQRPVMLRRSTLANLTHALAVHGMPRAQRREQARRALAVAGLEDRARQPARTLSGGEQQRLAIARAWALEPEVLLLDEPTANLDPEATAAIEALVRAVEARGTRIIMTTHDIGQARRLATEVMFLHRGRLLEHDAAHAFFAGPATPAAASFIGGGLPL